MTYLLQEIFDMGASIQDGRQAEDVLLHMQIDMAGMVSALNVAETAMTRMGVGKPSLDTSYMDGIAESCMEMMIRSLDLIRVLRPEFTEAKMIWRFQSRTPDQQSWFDHEADRVATLSEKGLRDAIFSIMAHSGMIATSMPRIATASVADDVIRRALSMERSCLGILLQIIGTGDRKGIEPALQQLAAPLLEDWQASFQVQQEQAEGMREAG